MSRRRFRDRHRTGLRSGWRPSKPTRRTTRRRPDSPRSAGHYRSSLPIAGWTFRSAGSCWQRPIAASSRPSSSRATRSPRCVLPGNARASSSTSRRSTGGSMTSGPGATTGRLQSGSLRARYRRQQGTPAAGAGVPGTGLPDGHAELGCARSPPPGARHRHVRPRGLRTAGSPVERSPCGAAQPLDRVGQASGSSGSCGQPAERPLG